MDFRVDGVSNVVEEMMTNQFGPVDRVGSINEVGKNLAEETKSVLSVIMISSVFQWQADI